MSLTFFSKSKFLCSSYKNFYVASLKCSSKSLETKTEPSQPTNNYENLLRRTHKPNNFERKILVWTGRYKSAGEIPGEVTHETMEKARNKARIKVANYMMVATFLGCIFMVVRGKKAAEKGETISQMNINWHKELSGDGKSQ